MKNIDEMKEAKNQIESQIESMLTDFYADYGLVAECTVDCKEGFTMGSKDEPKYTVELKLK